MSTPRNIFNYGTQADFDYAVSAGLIDPNLLYFITDTQRIYKGTELITVTSVFYPVQLPTIASAKEHTMYVVDDYVYIKHDEQFICLNHELIDGAINSLTLFDPGVILKSTDQQVASDDKLITAKAAMNYASTAAQTASADAFVGATFNEPTGVINYSLNDTSRSFDLGLDGLVHSPAYDTSKYQLTIPVYGQEDIVVSFPKCVKSGRFEPNYLLPDGTYGPAIVLVVDAPGEPSGEMEIVIPAAGLIDTYTGGTTNSIAVTISDENEITATLKIDPASGKLSITEHGLNIDLSDYALHANPADVDKIAIIDANGNFKGSKKIVEVYTPDDPTISDKIPVFGVVAAAIDAALATVGEHILGEGPINKVIISTQQGIVRSNYEIGGATLNPSASANLLATEAAVIDAVTWKPATASI